MSTEVKNDAKHQDSRNNQLSNPRINMTVEDLLQLTGPLPIVLGRYRGCGGFKRNNKVDPTTGRAYESFYTTHFLEVQADGLFDQVRILESFEQDHPDYRTPYKVDAIYLFPVSKFVPEKGGKVVAMPRNIRAVEIK